MPDSEGEGQHANYHSLQVCVCNIKLLCGQPEGSGRGSPCLLRSGAFVKLLSWLLL